jgi:hypothetical protein
LAERETGPEACGLKTPEFEGAVHLHQIKQLGRRGFSAGHIFCFESVWWREQYIMITPAQIYPQEIYHDMLIAVSGPLAVTSISF